MVGAVIRQAVLTDAEDIAAVHVTTWQYAYRGLVPDDFLSGLSVQAQAEQWRKNLRCMTGEIVVWVAGVDGRVIGFCSLGPSRDEDAASNTGELYAIYVDPRFMRRGIGSALMRAGHSTLLQLGHQKATLWVATANKRARAFYERGGWQADGAEMIDGHGDVSLHVVRYSIVYPIS